MEEKQKRKCKTTISKISSTEFEALLICPSKKIGGQSVPKNFCAWEGEIPLDHDWKIPNPVAAFSGNLFFKTIHWLFAVYLEINIIYLSIILAPRGSIHQRCALPKAYPHHYIFQLKKRNGKALGMTSGGHLLPLQWVYAHEKKIRER